MDLGTGDSSVTNLGLRPIRNVAKTEWPFDSDPEDDDRIVDDGKTFIVRSVPGDPVWRFSGNGDHLMRIHTKQQ